MNASINLFQIECSTIKYFIIYFIILLITSFTANGTLISTYLKNRQYMRNVQFLKLSIAILNLLGTAFDMPLLTINAFNCR